MRALGTSAERIHKESPLTQVPDGTDVFFIPIFKHHAGFGGAPIVAMDSFFVSRRSRLKSAFGHWLAEMPCEVGATPGLWAIWEDCGTHMGRAGYFSTMLLFRS